MRSYIASDSVPLVFQYCELLNTKFRFFTSQLPSAFFSLRAWECLPEDSSDRSLNSESFCWSPASSTNRALPVSLKL